MKDEGLREITRESSTRQKRLLCTKYLTVDRCSEVKKVWGHSHDNVGGFLGFVRLLGREEHDRESGKLARSC